MALAQGTELARHRTVRRSVRNRDETSPQRGIGSQEDRRDALDSIFKALADSTRRDILGLLTEKPLAVNQIVDHFHLTQPSISRHLAILRGAGLVHHRRSGQRVIYRLGDSDRVALATGFLDTLSPPSDRRQAI